jgi:UDP-glucuronate 4-epimerase
MAIRLFCSRIWWGEPVEVFGDGSMRRDYTYIDDIVWGVRAALERDHGYRIYNLGESATTDLLALLDRLEHLLGKRAVRRHVPAPAGDVQVTYADVSRARAELGYAPSVALEEGLRRFVD